MPEPEFATQICRSGLCPRRRGVGLRLGIWTPPTVAGRACSYTRCLRPEFATPTCRSGLCPRSRGSVYASVYGSTNGRRQSLLLRAMPEVRFATQTCRSGLCPRRRGFGLPRYMTPQRSQAEPAPTRDAGDPNSQRQPVGAGSARDPGVRFTPRYMAQPTVAGRACSYTRCLRPEFATLTCRSGLCPRPTCGLRWIAT